MAVSTLCSFFGVEGGKRVNDNKKSRFIESVKIIH